MAKGDSFQERHLLRIEDYEFQDKNGIRDKYMFILNRSEDATFIIHALTTKQAQGFNPKDLGCQQAGKISYFYIPKGKVIGENGFSFELDTFIFFPNNIRKEFTKSLEKYPEDKVEHKDVINKQVLKDLIDCILNSMFVTPEQADNLLQTRKRL